MIRFAARHCRWLVLAFTLDATQAWAAGLTDSQRAALSGYVDELLECMSYNSLTMRCAELSPHLSNSDTVIALSKKNMDYLANFIAMAAPAAGVPNHEISARQVQAFNKVGAPMQGDCGNFRKMLDAYAYICKARTENAEGNLRSIVK